MHLFIHKFIYIHIYVYVSICLVTYTRRDVLPPTHGMVCVSPRSRRPRTATPTRGMQRCRNRQPSRLGVSSNRLGHPYRLACGNPSVNKGTATDPSNILGLSMSQCRNIRKRNKFVFQLKVFKGIYRY